MILSDLLPGHNLAKVQCVPCYRDRGNVIGMLMGLFFTKKTGSLPNLNKENPSSDAGDKIINIRH